MADDWAVGDLALCVNTEFDPVSHSCGFEIKVGCLYTVCEVKLMPSGKFYVADWVGLNFEEDPTRDDWSAWEQVHFRKIRPLTDEERDGFLADLDAPVSPAAPSRSHAGDRPNDDASNHSPLANPASSLPESVSAPNRDALSGFSDHRFHVAEVTDQ